MESYYLRCEFDKFWQRKFFSDSQSEHDSAVDSLNAMLNEVESGLSDAEQKKPMYDQNDYVDLEAVMKQMEKQKVFIILL